jgi:hypothetical protein
MSKLLKLQQGQVWKMGESFLRITRLERMAVEYKCATGPAGKGATLHSVTKKEFCRLIKSAVLQPCAPAPLPRPARPE